jgi:ribosomal protein S18 acetylase RimI-like enzyme
LDASSRPFTAEVNETFHSCLNTSPVVGATSPTIAEVAEMPMKAPAMPGADVVAAFKIHPLRAREAVTRPPITVDFVFTSPDCRLLRLTIGTLAHLDAIIVPAHGRLNPDAFDSLGDGFRRSHAAYIALRNAGDFVYVQQLWVQDSSRNLGYGSALMRMLMGRSDVAFTKGALITLCAQPSDPFANSHQRDRLIRFYQRLDFRGLSDRTSIMYYDQTEHPIYGAPATTQEATYGH